MKRERQKMPGRPDGKIKCPCMSGKKFKDCHGASVDTTMTASPQLVMAPPSTLVKFDLACGQNPREGYEGVDIGGGKAKQTVDLLKFPWPWADNSVDALHCSHFIEHIPARVIEEGDLSDTHELCSQCKSWHAIGKHTDRDLAASGHVPLNCFVGQDMLFAFFDECWRILKPDCWMEVICPCARSNRAFQDPTHRRFIVAETFYYLFADWRKANALDHYQVRCNFAGEVNSIILAEVGARTPEVQTQRMHHEWNTVLDWTAKLKKLPAPSAPPTSTSEHSTGNPSSTFFSTSS